MRYRGVRHGPVELIQRMEAGDAVDASSYYFRDQPDVRNGASAIRPPKECGCDRCWPLTGRRTDRQHLRSCEQLGGVGHGGPPLSRDGSRHWSIGMQCLLGAACRLRIANVFYAKTKSPKKQTLGEVRFRPGGAAQLALRSIPSRRSNSG
jgi:hypothetical protein